MTHPILIQHFILSEDDSPAAKQAKAKGLVGLPYGRYADKSGNVVAQSRDGQLQMLDKPVPKAQTATPQNRNAAARTSNPASTAHDRMNNVTKSVGKIPSAKTTENDPAKQLAMQVKGSVSNLMSPQDSFIFTGALINAMRYSTDKSYDMSPEALLNMAYAMGATNIPPEALGLGMDAWQKFRQRQIQHIHKGSKERQMQLSHFIPEEIQDRTDLLMTTPGAPYGNINANFSIMPNVARKYLRSWARYVKVCYKLWGLSENWPPRVTEIAKRLGQRVENAMGAPQPPQETDPTGTNPYTGDLTA